jgi:hypothetical protein
MVFGGVVLVLATAIPIVGELIAHATRVEHLLIPVGLLLLLYIALFVAYFVFVSRVGVETSLAGVRSVSLSGSVFLEWGSIEAFVVGHYRPLSQCVLAEQRDGSRVPLNALAAWTFSAHVLEPYRDALEA